MPKFIKIVETNLTKEMKTKGFKRVMYSNTRLMYEKETEPDFVIGIAISTVTESADLTFYTSSQIITKNTYLIHFYSLPEISKIYEDKKKIRLQIDQYGVPNIHDWWLNVHKEEELVELPEICEIGRKFIEENCGTIQKCLELYDSNKYEDHIFQSEMGWLHFGFLNAVYGSKERAVELLEKFVDSILEYQKQKIGTNFEYLNDEKNGKWFDFYRMRACEAVIEAIKKGKNSEEIKELVKYHTDLEEEESKKRHGK